FIKGPLLYFAQSLLKLGDAPASKANNDQVSLNDDASMKVNSNVEEQLEDLTILPTNSEIQTPEMHKAMGAAQIFKKASMSSSILPTNSEELLNEQSLEKEGTTKTNNDQVSLNDVAFMTVNSNVKEQFPSMPSKPSPNPSITSPTASQFPSMPSKGIILPP
ncbi:putative LRR and NB-ARC domain disease resistance protein, partial [Trifolium pratense]